jgi:hypothetical protein
MVSHKVLQISWRVTVTADYETDVSTTHGGHGID